MPRKTFGKKHSQLIKNTEEALRKARTSDKKRKEIIRGMREDLRKYGSLGK